MDFGIKASQAGKDIEEAGDSELIFSSSWPLPKILFQGRIKNTVFIDTAVDNSAVLVNHDLGYVPMFFAWTASDTTFSIFRQIVSADNENIYVSAAGGGAGSFTFDIGLFIFDIDIEKNYTAPNIDLGTSSNVGTDKDFGIKLSKPNKDMSSDDPRDFILHSATRSPLIHAVINGKPDANDKFQYTHDLPYNPMFLAYSRGRVSATSPIVNAYQLNTSFAGITTDKQTITLTSAAATRNPKLSLVILKDPFQIDTEITVNQ